MIDDNGGDNDIDITTIAREEAHRTVDNQIQTLNDIDTKAARILRINLVLLSITLTGFSITINLQSSQETKSAPLHVVDLVNGYTLAGLVLLLLSTAVAGITYTASSLRIGMNPRDLRDVLDNQYSDRQNLDGLVSSYASWIQYNYEINAKNAPLGTMTILLLIYAMTALALGVKAAATEGVEWWLAVISVFLLTGMTWTTGIWGQLRRYWRTRRKRR